MSLLPSVEATHPHNATLHTPWSQLLLPHFGSLKLPLWDPGLQPLPCRRREDGFSHSASSPKQIVLKLWGDSTISCSILMEMCSSPWSKLAHLPSWFLPVHSFSWCSLQKWGTFPGVMETGLKSEVDVTEREDCCLYTGQRLSWWNLAPVPKWSICFPWRTEKETSMGCTHPTLGCPSVFGVCLRQTRALG